MRPDSFKIINACFSTLLTIIGTLIVLNLNGISKTIDILETRFDTHATKVEKFMSNVDIRISILEYQMKSVSHKEYKNAL